MGNIKIILIGLLIFVLFLILSILLKKAVTLAVALLITYILFNVGFIWSSDELRKNLRADLWLTEESEEKMSEFMDSFTEKRDKQELINVDKIGKGVNDNLEKTKEKIKGSVKQEEINENIDEFVKEIKNYEK